MVTKMLFLQEKKYAILRSFVKINKLWTILMLFIFLCSLGPLY